MRAELRSARRRGGSDGDGAGVGWSVWDAATGKSNYFTLDAARGKHWDMAGTWDPRVKSISTRDATEVELLYSRRRKEVSCAQSGLGTCLAALEPSSIKSSSLGLITLRLRGDEPLYTWAALGLVLVLAGLQTVKSTSIAPKAQPWACLQSNGVPNYYTLGAAAAFAQMCAKAWSASQVSNRLPVVFSDLVHLDLKRA